MHEKKNEKAIERHDESTSIRANSLFSGNDSQSNSVLIYLPQFIDVFKSLTGLLPSFDKRVEKMTMIEFLVYSRKPCCKLEADFS